MSDCRKLSRIRLFQNYVEIVISEYLKFLNKLMEMILDILSLTRNANAGIRSICRVINPYVCPSSDYQLCYNQTFNETILSTKKVFRIWS